VGIDYSNFVAAADVTGDGLLDLVTNGPPASGSVVHVQVGLGAASFAPPVTTTLAPGLNSISLGDLDDDGRADLVCIANPEGLSVALATGAGAFGTPVLVSHAQTTHPGPALGDVDGDGDLDIAFLDPDQNHVRIALNGGAASFTVLPAHDHATEEGLWLADVDGDGRLDLLGGGVSLGYGDGTFAPQDLGLVDGTPADVDGDGDLDATSFGVVWENHPH
jgi:hypothetical protein